MSEEKITLEEWGNRIATSQYVVLRFNYALGMTWVLNTTDGLVYVVTYDDGFIRVKDENYNITWD